MSESQTTLELFTAWRGGDGPSGQQMAQRIADWYYAIATSRLGESRGRGPCDAACASFGQGVVNVTEGRALVSWAHTIIEEQLAKAGDVARNGDEPNAYTASHSPKALLVLAKAALPTEIALLELVYGGHASEEEIDRVAEPLGGNPIGVLTARYRVKHWLKNQAAVPFSVTPEVPNLDRAPLPQYESGAMGSPDEAHQFEQWMLTDLELCRDIAEFATFSVALRGGLTGVTAAPQPSAPKGDGATQPQPASAASGAMRTSGGSKTFLIVVVIAIILALLALSAVVAATFIF